MLPDILERHRDELAFLWPMRAVAVHAPHLDLRALADLDERVEAHLDGLRVGGDAGARVLRNALDEGEPGLAFAFAVLAIESGEAARLAPVLEMATEPRVARAVISAFGWASPARAATVAEALLVASAPSLHRALGLAGLAAHRRDPGGELGNAVLDPAPIVRARALRAAGELGRRDLLSDMARARADADEACRFWAAWSGVLLGDEAAIPALWDFAESISPWAERAVLLVARRAEPRDALARLTVLAARPEHARVALIGAGALGDPGAMPWVLAHLEEAKLARLAGEAFTTITGIAIEKDLATKAPAGFRAGPSDDPADDDVALDPDRDRPWPAPAAIAAAFRARGGELRRGARHLLGQPITEGFTLRVLREGRLRERAAAALERSLLVSGRPLFEVRAPAFRQKPG